MFSLSKKDGANVLIYSFNRATIPEKTAPEMKFFNFPLPLRP